jgi:hypothetical protein
MHSQKGGDINGLAMRRSQVVSQGNCGNSTQHGDKRIDSHLLQGMFGRDEAGAGAEEYTGLIMCRPCYMCNDTDATQAEIDQALEEDFPGYLGSFNLV